MSNYITIDDLLELKQRQYWRVGRDRIEGLKQIKDGMGEYIIGSNKYGNLTLMGDEIIVVDGDVVEYVNGEHVLTLNK